MLLHVLQKEMRHLRMEAIKLPKDAREVMPCISGTVHLHWHTRVGGRPSNECKILQEEHGASDPAGPPPGAGTAAQEAGRPPESAGLAIDDDELLQMQAANQVMVSL